MGGASVDHILGLIWREWFWAFLGYVCLETWFEESNLFGLFFFLGLAAWRVRTELRLAATRAEATQAQLMATVPGQVAEGGQGQVFENNAPSPHLPEERPTTVVVRLPSDRKRAREKAKLTKLGKLIVFAGTALLLILLILAPRLFSR